MVKIDIPIEKVAERAKGMAQGAVSGAMGNVPGSSSSGGADVTDNDTGTDGQNMSREMQQINARLDDGESIKLFGRASRVGIGVGMVTPPSIYVTEKRVIIRSPTRLGAGEKVEDYKYDEITSIRIEKGLRNSGLILAIPGVTSDLSQHVKGKAMGKIDGLDKKKAEQIYEYVREKIREAKEQRNAPQIVQQAAAAEDPLSVLKKRFVNGEITAEQYAEMKKVLED